MEGEEEENPRLISNSALPLSPLQTFFPLPSSLFLPSFPFGASQSSATSKIYRGGWEVNQHKTGESIAHKLKVHSSFSSPRQGVRFAKMITLTGAPGIYQLPLPPLSTFLKHWHLLPLSILVIRERERVETQAGRERGEEEEGEVTEI